MKKLLTAVLAVMLLVSAAGCGNHKDTAEEHAEKLARGEVESNAKVAKDAAPPKAEIPTADPALNAEAEVKDDGTAEFSINTTKTGEYIDKAEKDYKSFSLLPIQSADFFKNKKLKLIAIVEDHSMSFVEELGMTLEVTEIGRAHV